MTTDTAQINSSGKEQFLAGLPPHLRGACYNLFLYEARSCVTDPADIVCNVLAVLARRTETARGPSLANARLMLAAVRDNLQGAEECALAALAHDDRPRAEILEEREHVRREAIQSWKEKQAPTEKQIGYTKRLGYSGPAPVTMAEASRIIDDCQRGARP